MKLRKTDARKWLRVYLKTTGTDYGLFVRATWKAKGHKQPFSPWFKKEADIIWLLARQKARMGDRLVLP